MANKTSPRDTTIIDMINTTPATAATTTTTTTTATAVGWRDKRRA